jgi:hypothetical protein
MAQPKTMCRLACGRPAGAQIGRDLESEACRSHWRLAVEAVDLAFAPAREVVPGVAAGLGEAQRPPVQEHHLVVVAVGGVAWQERTDGGCGGYVGMLEVKRGRMFEGNPAEGLDCLAVDLGTGTEAEGMES